MSRLTNTNANTNANTNINAKTNANMNTNTNMSYLCHIEEDTEASRRINDRRFMNVNQPGSLQSRADISSQLRNLSGFRNYNGRYCLSKP